MYKAQKDQVQVFGLRTQYGGGKTTGFALVYDSPEAMKKFEPAYRLIRVGMATKRERASRQQRSSTPPSPSRRAAFLGRMLTRASDQQASSARTDKRRCAARPRSRAPRPRRRNRRDEAAGRCRIQGFGHGAGALGTLRPCEGRRAVGARGLAGESPLKTTWGRKGSGPTVFLEYASMKSRCLFFLDARGAATSVGGRGDARAGWLE